MRWLQKCLAFLLVLSGVIFICAPRYLGSRDDSTLHSSVDPWINSQMQSLRMGLSAFQFRTRADAVKVYQQYQSKKKPSLFSLGDSALMAVRINGRFMRSSGVSNLPYLESALREENATTDSLRIKFEGEKYYLFTKAIVDGAEAYLLYDPAVLSSYLIEGAEPRIWLTDLTGKAIFSSQAKYGGGELQNLKPIAMAINSVNSSGNFDFSGNYLGIDGKEHFGKWIYLKEFNLIAGVEISEPTSSGRSYPFWVLQLFSIVCFMSAGLLWIYPSYSSDLKNKSENLYFDSERLTPEALAYLENAKRSADEAILNAKNIEAAANETLRQRSVVGQALRVAQWENQLLHDFEEKILPLCTGKQVWPQFAQMIVERTPGVIAVNYRYSNTSFSLVPDGVFTVVDLAENAASYLADARIFIGNTRYLENIESTEAFSRWNLARIKHMPIGDTSFHTISIDRPHPYRGILLLLYQADLNRNGELDSTFALFDLLRNRLSSFCDTQSKLLQFSNEKGIEGQPLASKANSTRSKTIEH